MIRTMLPKITSNVNTILPTIRETVTTSFEYKMNFDGCSKGNPGLCGAGAVIYYKNDEIWAESFFVGENATNNRAEYAGLILGLQQAIELKISTLHVQGDSQLVINQMKGLYQCNSQNLIPLYERAKELESNFEKIHYEHILRHLNKRADHLSNIAIMKYYKP